MHRLCRLFLGLLLQVAGAAVSNAQASKAAVDLSQWLVEVRRADQSVHYFEALGNVTSHMNYLPALDSLGDGDQRLRNLRSVKIEAQPKADLVALTVFVAKEPERIEVPQDGWQQIRSLLLGPGQEVLLRELESFGLAPLQLSLVPKQPDEPSGFEFVNEVPEIELVNWEESRHKILLTLRNRSQRNIYALHFAEWHNGVNAGSMARIGTLELPALGIEEQKVFQFSVPRKEGQPLKEWKSVLACVVFEDGSFDGDAVEASRILAERFGKRLFQESLCSYLSKQPFQPRDEAALQRLQSLALDFERMGKEAPFDLEDFLHLFPEFRSSEFESLQLHIRQGIQQQAARAAAFILQSNSSPPLEERLSSHPQFALHLFESLQDRCAND